MVFEIRNRFFLLQILLTTLLAISLGYYSLKHLTASFINLRLKILSPQEEESKKKPNQKKSPLQSHFKKLEESLSLARMGCVKEKDNPFYCLKVSELGLEAFSLSPDEKLRLMEILHPHAPKRMDEDQMLIREIFELLYSSLVLNPSNFRSLLYLTQLVEISLNFAKDFIDLDSMKDAHALSGHYIERALKLNPSHAQLNSLAGKYFLQMREAEKAGQYFRKALDLNRNLSATIFSEIQYERDREEVIDLILENKPELQSLYGDFLFDSKNYEDAEEYFNENFRLSRDRMAPYRKLCQLYTASGKNEETRILSERMLKEGYVKKAEDLSEVYYHIASAMEKSGDLHGAIEAAQKAVENNGQEIRNHYQLARLHLKNGETDLALSRLQVILRRFDRKTIRESGINVHLLLGEAYEKKDDILKAYEEYNKALKLNPDNNEIRKKINFLAKGLR
ncbi:MAG: tetratricopeptide repeat protein [Acidobacteriota bacterium]